MDKRLFAVWSIVSGLMLGLVGLMVFYGKPLGLSVPLYALVTVAVVLVSARQAGLPLRRRNLWPVIPLLLFAGMLAIFDNRTLRLVNLAAGVFGWNAARARAWALLDPLRDTLPVHQRDSDTFYGCSSAARMAGYSS